MVEHEIVLVRALRVVMHDVLYDKKKNDGE
jgi:hypothetical protein